MEKEKRYIVAARCKDRPNPIIGAVRRKCSRCKKCVWVGKALQNEEVDGIICDECIKESEFKDMRFILKPGVIDEFVEHMNRRKLIGM